MLALLLWGFVGPPEVQMYAYGVSTTSSRSGSMIMLLGKDWSEQWSGKALHVWAPDVINI